MAACSLKRADWHAGITLRVSDVRCEVRLFTAVFLTRSRRVIISVCVFECVWVTERESRPPGD